MSAATKFLFDADFATGHARTPAEPTITLAEHARTLAEAEAAAQRRGYVEGRTEAAAEAERRVAAALERIATSLGEANRSLNAVEARLECEAVEVAVAVAGKLAPALLAREPLAEISALASECFRELTAAPHLAVRVNDALYAAVRDKLEALSRTSGFEGRLVVLAEPTTAVGDCRIEWADGGINRDSAAVAAAINDAVARYVGARLSLAASARDTSEARR